MNGKRFQFFRDPENWYMLSLLAIVICLFFLVLVSLQPKAAIGQEITSWQITFQWDANQEPDLAGYRLYQSTSSFNGVIPEGMDPVLAITDNATTGDFTVNSPGTYYYVLTAYDTSENESAPSNEQSRTFDLAGVSSPENFQVIKVTVIIETHP